MVIICASTTNFSRVRSVRTNDDLIIMQIAAENVGQRNFTWRIEYFGNEEKNVVMYPGDHANHECLCVPMDMYVDYEVIIISLFSLAPVIIC